MVKKENPFDTLLQEFVYYRTYSRWVDSKGRRETWDETVTRYCDYMKSKYKDKITDKEYKDVYNAIYNLEVMPSMRALWSAGKAADSDNVSVYNCFAQETEFITDSGVKSFKDFESGDEIVVLTHTGSWKKAIVKNYGRQRLNKITYGLGRRGLDHIVFATQNHRWILNDNTETTDLSVGNYLAKNPDVSEFVYSSASPDERMYWCYGYVYGDGTRTKDAHGEYKYSMVRLCGSDKAYQDRFEEMGFKTSSSDSIQGDTYAYTGLYLKTLPNLEVESLGKIKAFVNGFLSADGAKNIIDNRIVFRSIQQSSKEAVSFLLKALPMCGYYIYRSDDFTGQVTNYGVRGFTKRIAFVNKEATQSNSMWRIRSIEKTDRTEDVWCLEVEEDHSFVFPNGVITGNCAFLVIEKLKDFAEILYIMMNGTGVGYSVERKYVNKLPVIKEKQDTSEVIEIVFEDSKMGWARGFEKVLECLWEDIEFTCNYSKVRPEGVRLKTFGGRASGSRPLMELVQFVTDIVERNRGFQIRPIDVHDICCKIAEVVVVGGVRRSACISLSDLTDNEMSNAKVGEFWHTNPQRSLANNSVAYTRKPDVISFIDEWKNLYRSKSGERGLFSRVAAQKKAAENGRRDSSKICGTNPSLRRGTKVLTTEGVFPIEELEGKKFNIRNLTGDISKATCWLSGKNKKLYCITLLGGHSYYCTAEHRWPVYVNGSYVKKQTNELSKNDLIPILKNSELPFGSKGDYSDGFFIGWLYGDGSVGYRSTGERIVSLCVSLEASKMGISDLLLSKLHGITNSNQVWVDRTKDRSTYEMTIDNKRLFSYLDTFGVTNKKEGLPQILFNEASEDFRKGFLDGILSSDGHIENSSKNSYRLTFVTSQKRIAEDLSDLLGLYGIRNSIKYSKATSSFPNGKDYNKLYDRYAVRVSDIYSMKHLASLISLRNTKNGVRLKSAILAETKFKLSEHNTKILSVVETDLHEDVWDIAVEDATHCFQLTQCITGNCGETLLRSREFCNLTEVVCRPEDTFETLKKKIQIATMLGTWQAGFTKFKYIDKSWKENCEDEALLGVSLTGLRDHKILGSVNDTAKKWLSDLKHVTIATNKRVAQKIGINRSAAITLVKPSGTVSLLVNCAPGAHVRPTDTGYYLRRIRIATTDPLCALMRDAGVPMKPEVGQTSENCTSWVLEFPCSAPKGARLKGQESAREQLEYWKMLRSFYCEQNPSITIYVDEEDWLDTAAWVYENFENVGGLTFLPSTDHVYQLAPYEDIDWRTYHELNKKIPDIDFIRLADYEFDDQTTASKELACTGDSCTLR